MKHLIPFALAALLAGCTRQDIREFTVEIPGLTEANQREVVEAFVIRKANQPSRVYDGIDPSSFRFDMAAKTLTMKYDSMKIARTNIRMLIQDKGIEVAFPSNTTGVAGYIDCTEK